MITNRQVLAVLLLACLGTVHAVPAQAGFKLIGPADDAAASDETSADNAPIIIDGGPKKIMRPQSRPMQSAAPILPPNETIIIAPEPIPPAPTPAASAPPAALEPDDVPVPSIETPQIVPTTAPVTETPAEPVIAAPVSMPAAAPKVPALQGFGKNVPLHIALRQIVPAGYEFAYGPQVNPAMLISWQGGKSWRDVLQETVATKSLTVHEKGNVIAISNPNAKMLSASNAPAIDNIVTQPVAPMAPVAPKPVQTTMASEQDSMFMRSSSLATQNTMDNTTNQVAGMLPPVGATAVAVSTMPMGAAVDLNNVQTWQATRGSTLRQTLEQWSARVGIDLNWNSEYDYPVQASLAVEGDFENAVRTILKGFADANPQPIAQLFKGNAVNQPVMVITSRGNDYTEKQ